MAYYGNPISVPAGGTGRSTITGILSSPGGTAPVTANPLTQYGILIGGAGDTVTTLSPPASKSVIASGGGTAAPSWVSSATAGNQVLIQSQTVSTANNVSFTTGITSTYNQYVLYFTNILCTGANAMLINLSSNGGTSYVQSGYLSGNNLYAYNSTSGTNNNASTGIYICRLNATTDVACGYVRLFNVTSGSGITMTNGQHCILVATPLSSMARTCGGISASVWNALRIVSVGGGTIAGTFTLYGVVE